MWYKSWCNFYHVAGRRRPDEAISDQSEDAQRAWELQWRSRFIPTTNLDEVKQYETLFIFHPAQALVRPLIRRASDAASGLHRPGVVGSVV